MTVMKQARRKARNVMFRDEHPDLGDSRREILSGLQRDQKAVNPKWFYDERGSQLFDQITRLPEYYPTRTEVGILQKNRSEISACCGSGCLFIEPGSGSSEKVRILLETLRPSAYVPVDISADFLEEAALKLGDEYPWLDIYAVCADFNRNWSYVDDLPDGKRVVFYPGSTIGNLEPEAAVGFLGRVREIVGDAGGAVVGVDTHKSADRLNAAYNDAAGVTAEFNLNVLRRMNDLLDAEFDEGSFRHHAFYNTDVKRIEMHLVSERAQAVRCNGAVVEFAEGETIHTENSYKYTVEDFAELVAAAGLEVQHSWMDADELFSVHYLRAA
jgi:dimethylhistidine N-methyltransferase